MGLGVLVSGCVGGMPPEDAERNRQLGISRFEIVQTAEATTVVGSSADGAVVARLNLVHGRFALSGIFADGHADPWVVGRRLVVSVLGQNMRWETKGFGPTLRMPAHPRTHGAVAAFLEHEHVKSILTRWNIGFEVESSVGDFPESAPTGFECRVNGTHPGDCSGELTCPTMFSRSSSDTPSTCGGGARAADAWIVHQRGVDQAGPEGEPELLGNSYSLDGVRTTNNESVIGLCCPTTATREAFFAFKTCPDPCGADECPTRRGTAGKAPFGQCGACPLYPTDKCQIAIVEAGWLDPHAPHDLERPSGDDKRVRNMCVRLAWTCGDGICDIDETCGSCAADCTCSQLNLDPDLDHPVDRHTKVADGRRLVVR